MNQMSLASREERYEKGRGQGGGEGNGKSRRPQDFTRGIGKVNLNSYLLAYVTEFRSSTQGTIR